MQYTTEMRLIRVMCSGRVDMSHVLKAFAKGMDGVFIGACHLGECNYITHGNYHALNMTLLFKKILKHIGLDPDRLQMNFMSGAEANVYVESVNNFVKRIRELGPLGKGKSENADSNDLNGKFNEIRKLIPYIKIAKNDKLAKQLKNPDEYDAYFTDQEIDELFTNVVSYYIDPGKCQACMSCARRCPADAVISAKNQVHVIDQEKCIKCGTCFEACPPKFGAVTKIAGKPIPDPLPEDKRTIVRKKEAKAS